MYYVVTKMSDVYPDVQGISSKYMSWQVWQKMALMYGTVMAGMTNKWHLGVVKLSWQLALGCGKTDCHDRCCENWSTIFLSEYQCNNTFFFFFFTPVMYKNGDREHLSVIQCKFLTESLS